MTNPTIFDSHNLADTDRLGAALAASIPDGTTVALSGTLGAGKTRLVQAICVGCGVPAEEVVSPTFVLCQEYRGRRRLVHLDAYRIADDDEFLQLGVDEYFASDAIVLIEWAERVARCLPAERIEIQIEPLGETSRRFSIRASGARLAGVTASLAATFPLPAGEGSRDG
jgi:tRNA threonylcarbamoyladenosine biosynthesis protein TsaE